MVQIRVEAGRFWVVRMGRDIDEGVVEGMKKEDFEAYEKVLLDSEKTPATKEFPFDLISRKISILKDFCKVVDKNLNDITEGYRRVCIENKINPSVSLFDYIVFDIAMFYDCAIRRFNFDNKSMPKSYNKIMRFRNNVMAHFGDKINSNADLVDEYKLANGDDGKGFEEIWKDYVEFRDELFTRIKNEN